MSAIETKGRPMALPESPADVQSGLTPKEFKAIYDYVLDELERLYGGHSIHTDRTHVVMGWNTTIDTFEVPVGYCVRLQTQHHERGVFLNLYIGKGRIQDCAGVASWRIHHKAPHLPGQFTITGLRYIASEPDRPLDTTFDLHLDHPLVAGALGNDPDADDFIMDVLNAIKWWRLQRPSAK